MPRTTCFKGLGAFDAPDAEWVVRGQVVDATGPLNAVQVSVFERDLFFRREGNSTGQLLGTGITANRSTRPGGGWFEATYTLSDFAAGDIPTAGDAGETIPDLIFALGKDAQPLGTFESTVDGRNVGIAASPSSKEMSHETHHCSPEPR